MKTECPYTNLEAEHRKFVDYWKAKAGQHATKVDWNATWRNWIRRADEHVPARASGKPAGGRTWVDVARDLDAQEQPTLDANVIDIGGSA